MLKSSWIFKRNGAYLVEKKMFEKKQRFSTLEVWVLWTCKTIFYLCQALKKLQLMENIPIFWDNPNYYASIVIFQRYKNVVLRSVHSLGWIFLLWFYLKQNVFSSKYPQSNQTLINWTFKFDLPSYKSHLELFIDSHINATV
jgi:hypothetical protein